jgi:FAD/FMN-containing dehydrogenase/Fe-S oxidoreductase
VPPEVDRQLIAEDLRGLVAGEVHVSPVFVQMYASDASIYEVAPLGIVRPRGLADVVACLKYAADNNISVHPRGSGTGLTGGCLGGGLVLDFSHAMRRVLRIEDDEATFQPGVILSHLNRQLAKRGRLFGPDPSSAAVATMGSVLAVNRTGSHWLQYGDPRQQVRSMQVVLADGEVITAGQHEWTAQTSGESRRDKIIRQLVRLFEENEQIIQESKTDALVNTSGYHLHDVWKDGTFDLARLLVGSEGTLGVITEATVETHVAPRHRGVLLLFFDRLDKAARAVQELRRHSITACDLMDRRLLRLARDTDVRYDVLLPDSAEAMLLIECCDEDVAELGQRLSKLAQLICRKRKLAFESRTALDPPDVTLFWQLIEHTVPTLYRLSGSERPLPFIEDIAVPPASLPEFLKTAQSVFQKHEVTASMFGHAGHGQLHLRPFLDLSNDDHVAKMQRLSEDLYAEVAKVNGTISGEHGDGLSRSWYVRKQSPGVFNLLREVKRIFDPTSILNPGKIADVQLHSPSTSLRHVTPPRTGTTSTSTASAASVEDGTLLPANDGTASVTEAAAIGDRQAAPIELLLNWSEADIVETARSCNGCGTCRTQLESVRMCPIFRFAPAEEASPRAKANLLRGLLTNDLSQDDLVGDELKDVADLCVHCYQCRDECPAGVDIPKLMLEAKAQYVATNGLSFGDWLITRLDLVAAWAMNFRTVVNYLIASKRTRWLIEKTIGIAQNRKLPLLAQRSFMSVAAKQKLTKPARTDTLKVLFFTDIYANWFDTQLAEAVVATFQHNGVSVFVHPKQVQSGMELITLGAVEKAKLLARRNINILAEAVRQGFHIVTAEPTAALCLKLEYPNLIDDEQSAIVAENTHEACSYLWKMHQRGQLELDLKPINATVGYHLPCHLKALGVGSPGENLLRLVPGLNVKRLESGCSGMAGTYGLKAANYRNSLRAGWPLVSAMRDPLITVGTTECSPCKIQMEQGTNKPTIHPLKLLALAYGLMPEIGELLTTRSKDMVVT